MNQFIKYSKYIKISGVLVLFLSLQSCFVAKDYQRPEFTENQDLYRTDNLPVDSLSLADVSWKELFSDPFLNKYIDEGLQNNLDIRVALQQIMAAEAYAKQGRAGYLPSINGNASVTHQELAKNSQFGSFFDGGITQYALTTDLSWEADIWGKIRSTKRATEADYLQSVAAHQAVKTRLVASIASTYYQLLALDNQKEIAEQTIINQDSSVFTIQSLKDAGQANQVAVDQNVAQLNNTKALLVDIDVAIFKTENILNLLLGRAPKEIQRGKLQNQELETEIKLGVPFMLVQNRPDVMAAEYNLISAFEMTNVARSNFYPSITITGSGGFQSLELKNLIDTKSLFANLVGGLAQPIFNKRRIRTQFEVAQAQKESAVANFQKSLLEAGKEVSDALYTYNAETNKFRFRTLEVEALRQAENNSELLLKNGYANYLDLLTARQSALNAELNVINSKLQQLLSIVDLYEALGGGWR